MQAMQKGKWPRQYTTRTQSREGAVGLVARRRMACALPWWRVADVDLGSGLRLPGAVASSMLKTDVIIDFADRQACDVGGMFV